MKLRYLRVCNQPPLEDVAINFGHESVLDRNCAIHFVVGVNGSGKSRLLQALAEIFLSLDPNFGNQRVSLPNFPVTLVYDLGKENDARTIYLRHQDQSPSKTVLIEFKRVLDKNEVKDWESLQQSIEDIEQTQELEDLPLFRSEPTISKKDYKKFLGNDMPGTGSMGVYLPSIVLAYTSGATKAWEAIFSHLNIEPESINTNVNIDNERPLEWSLYQEQDLKKKQGEPIPEREQDVSSGLEERQFSRIGILVKPDDLKLAFCAVALEQAIDDFKNTPTEADKNQFIERINLSIETKERTAGLRGILNTIDWLWPITITLRINYKPTEIKKSHRDKLAKLADVANPIIRTPEPGTSRLFIFDLRCPLNKQDAVDKSTANALYETVTGKDKKSSKPFDFFQELYNWKQEGFLEDVQIAFRKRNLKDILLYDWLSDGEQVFLGRMALFHLLKGKDDALLLLDEPETHFNDLWKREIVDIIDESLSNDSTEVVISTHSSIALTDIFNTEINLLRKNPETGESIASQLTTPTFGADPGEIMINVFEARDSIGQRALEYLNKLLDKNWENHNKEDLEYLIRRIGAGYHRSELRTIWRKLNATQD